MVKQMETKNDTKRYTSKELLDRFESYLKKRQERAKHFATSQLKEAGMTKKALKELKEKNPNVDPELRKYMFAARADVALDLADGLEDDIKEIKAYKKHKKLIKV